MKNKDIKECAKKIAQAEYVLQTSSDNKKREQAKEVIMAISERVTSLDDMMRIDEYVQEILAKILTK